MREKTKQESPQAASWRLPPSVLKQLRERAVRERRTQVEVLKAALERYFASEVKS